MSTHRQPCSGKAETGADEHQLEAIDHSQSPEFKAALVRRRQGLHYRRNRDDKVFADMIVLKRDDGELTTVTMDEFTELKRA